MIKFKLGLMASALFLPGLMAVAQTPGITMQSTSPMSGSTANGNAAEFEAGMPFLVTNIEGDDIMIQGLLGALVDKDQTTGIGSVISDAESVEMRFDPVAKVMHIQAPSANQMVVAVVDLDGKVVFNQKFNSGTAEIDLSTLPASIYMVGCAVENQIVKTKKIILK